MEEAIYCNDESSGKDTHARDAGQSCVLGHTFVTLKFQNDMKHKETNKKI